MVRVSLLPLLSGLLLLLLLAGGAAVDVAAPVAESAALLRLKASFLDPSNALTGWSPAAPAAPCDATKPWRGVQCYNGIVIGLRLARLNLSGTFDAEALANLRALHSVDLKRNAFSGPLPASVTALRGLRALYLSHNAFSGPVPGEMFTSLRWLKKLYLNHNNFSGVLPAEALAAAARLLELHLEYNQLEGRLPAALPRSLRDFNVSHNRFSGEIPAALNQRYNSSAFEENPGLCGYMDGDTPCASPPQPPKDDIRVQKEVSAVAVIGIVVLVITLVGAAMVLMLRQQDGDGACDQLTKATSRKPPPAPEPQAIEMSPAAAGSGSSHGGGSRASRRRIGELVLMNEQRGEFGMSELMKATAEVLGNGTLGSAYKAAMRNGVTVAVKRMRDMNGVGRERFEEQMQTLGALRHPNVLTPLAYHYRKEEKLIVSEYMPGGSLLYVLHGDQTPNRVVLDWPARLKIAAGVVRGMAYLQSKLGGSRASMGDGTDFDAPPPPPHGNLKSGNILLDGDLQPRLVDYGFFQLVNPGQAPHAMAVFWSPEGMQDRAVSAKSDVFCLGVVLLELVTGKFPSQYLQNARGGTDVVQWAASAAAEKREADLVDPAVAAAAGEEAVRLLRVGVACTDFTLDRRPDMAEVARTVEEIVASAYGGA